MTSFDYDLFVIGAGSGGVRAARIAAGYGAKVAVAEEFRIGGTCVIRGCVPKKLYVTASRFRDELGEAAGFGWNAGASLFDWNKLRAAKEQEISRLSGLYSANLHAAGVTTIDARATVSGPHGIRLSDGRALTARIILVATGGTPAARPAIPGLDFCITSNEIFDLPALPRRLAIIGGGYIAVEFACAFARFGTEVTQMFRADAILRGFDDDMRSYLGQAMARDGIQLLPGAEPEAIESHDGGLLLRLSNGTVAEADHVLLATGRVPNTRGLGLETAGVACSVDGAILVDEFSCSSVPSIYAVGDVTNRINLTPVAIREGHCFADRVFGGKDAVADHRHVASAVFSTPEIGVIGLTEEEARRDYDIVDIYSTSFRPLRATLSGNQTKTVMKLVVDGTTDRILGIHLLGHDSGEMVQTLAIAMRMGVTKADFDATMPVHPTSAEELVTLRTRTARYRRTS